MTLSERHLLVALSEKPFVDLMELTGTLGESRATVHRTLSISLAEGIVGRVNHGTAHLSSSQRYHLTAYGIGEADWVLGFATPSDFVRAKSETRDQLSCEDKPSDRAMSKSASVLDFVGSGPPQLRWILSSLCLYAVGSSWR